MNFLNAKGPGAAATAHRAESAAFGKPTNLISSNEPSYTSALVAGEVRA